MIETMRNPFNRRRCDQQHRSAARCQVKPPFLWMSWWCSILSTPSRRAQFARRPRVW